MKQYEFHTINMGDVEDPEIYAAMPILEWQGTEQGQWVMDNCPDPQFRITNNHKSWGYHIHIYGPLTAQAAVFYELKWAGK